MAGKARKSTKIKKASSSALARRQKAAPAKKKRVEIDETVSIFDFRYRLILSGI